jgi:hypothetical protein
VLKQICCFIILNAYLHAGRVVVVHDAVLFEVKPQCRQPARAKWYAWHQNGALTLI